MTPREEITCQTRPTARSRRAPSGCSATSPALVEFTDGVLFGQVWTRTDLSPKDRSLVTVAALTALGHTDQLVFHLDFAKQNGNSEK